MQSKRTATPRPPCASRPIQQRRVAANLDIEEGCELRSRSNPFFTVIVALASKGIVSAEEGAADTPCDTVVDADFLSGDDFVARVGRHDSDSGCRL